MSVNFIGVDKIIGSLTHFIDIQKTEMAVHKACTLVERTAKIKAPKGNGDLRRSITSKIERDGDDVRGIVYTPLEYAPYVEYGTGLFAEKGDGRKDVPWHYQDDEGEWHSTSGQNPMPFLRPALDANREQIKRILREELTND